MNHQPKGKCFLRTVATLVTTVSLLMTLSYGQDQAQTWAGDWPMYNRDLAGTRYSPLEQINASNVAGLEQTWSYPLGRNVTTSDLTGGSAPSIPERAGNSGSPNWP